MTVIQQVSGDRMKIIMFFSLLLLVCSVSADQTETAVQQSDTQDIHAVLRELTASLALQNEQITVLQRENQVKQVAFSASLGKQSPTDTGPFTTETTLIFEHVITNIGNAYNQSTGIFTAPVRGVYHFEFHIFGTAGIRAGGSLFRNGDLICTAYEHPKSGSVSASNGVSLLLEVGDQVSVRLPIGSSIHENQNHHTTFSGHLIFTM
ncbi:complement C1q-like protein 4 [Oreochromis aureus]|uniref:complement C1q-like protein 4 n=1 Tax=Oreochromis aureus TaxID=47969 RepID=UPI0012BC2F23|nr:complement C1q-like protein 4 [Oreochromis aureus]